MPGLKRMFLVKPIQTAARTVAASALLLVSPVAALAATTTLSPGFVGVYIARVAKSAPSMTVSLGSDGTATVTGDLGKGSITSFGSWQESGHQIKVTFNAAEGEPSEPPMVFEAGHNQLHAVSWSHEAWGNAQPPTMQKGYKVKYLLWSTTMR
jgi:hypothetical protein